MKLFRYYLPVIAISLLPLVSVFLTNNLPHTHDGASHLPRMAAYYKALADGQLLPRWAGDLNYGYGLPLFNFIYQLPYLISSLFIKTGLSLVISFKLLMLLSFVGAGISMYLFSRELFKNERTAFLVTVFYQYSPFRLIEMMVRGSLGEMFSYAFIPLVLFGLTKIIKKTTYKNVVATALAVFFLVISHNSISLVFFGSAALFLFIMAGSVKKIIFGIIALSLGLSAAAFYWIPALVEHKYTYGDLFMKNMYLSHFPPFINFFLPNPFNNPSLETGGISVQIGILHVAVAIVTLYLLLMRRLKSDQRKLALYSFFLTVVTLFFMTGLSRFFWSNISLLRQFQFPWRLLSLISLTTSLLSAFVLNVKFINKKTVYWFIIFLTVVSTAYYWKPPLGFDRVTDEIKSYWNYPLNTTYFGETDVIWSEGPAKSFPKSPVETIEGRSEISDYYKKSNIHTYQISSSQKSVLVDHTQYFPGWRAYVDGHKAVIEFQNQNWRGQITFPVPAGKHSIKVIFEKSPVQFISEIVSWMTLSGLFTTLTIAKLKKI